MVRKIAQKSLPRCGRSLSVDLVSWEIEESVPVVGHLRGIVSHDLRSIHSPYVDCCLAANFLVRALLRGRIGTGLNGPEICHGGILHIFLLQFQMGQGRLAVLSLIILQFLLDLRVESQVIVLLIVCDDLVGIEISILQLLMMAAALKRIPRSDEPRHLLIQLADPE